MTYTQAAVERAMKVHEVLMQTTTGKRPGSGSSTGSGRPRQAGAAAAEGPDHS